MIETTWEWRECGVGREEGGAMVKGGRNGCEREVQ